MKNILIASNSQDTITYQPIASLLRSAGYNPIIYDADLVAGGKNSLYIGINKSGELKVTYEGRPISSATIAAAWYRRPNFFGRLPEDHLWSSSLDDERRRLQETIWNLIPDAIWLNSPRRITQAEHKIFQLAAARRAGFLIPATVIANQWTEILTISSDKLIFKTIRGELVTKSSVKYLYSTVLENRDEALPLDSLPFPGIWQNYIPKKREWRVTIVGSQVFAAAIYTSEDAKDDWRQHQESSSVIFKAERFPSTAITKCFKLLHYFKLRFGAFDFIETPAGEIIFLE